MPGAIGYLPDGSVVSFFVLPGACSSELLFEASLVALLGVVRLLSRPFRVRGTANAAGVSKPAALSRPRAV